VQRRTQRPTRESVIQAEGHLFHKGLSRHGVPDIVPEADVAKGTFYDEFESTEALAMRLPMCSTFVSCPLVS
jgi:AcrR family transcriptional regulator